LIILAAWCGILFAYGIASGPLYRTESLRAIIGRECLHGNWLFPVLYGEPFLTKPPGQYVAIGLCSLPFGEVSAVSARLPSVLAASATVFLTYFLFRRALDDRAALLAALLLPTSVLWLDKAPSAEIDMTLVGWVMAAIVLAHRALERASSFAWLVALLCVAGGTLTKWTAPAFFYLTLVPLLAWRGELRVLLRWRHLLACAMGASVCALWAVAVAQRVGWDVLVETVRSEALYRFAPKPASKSSASLEVAAYPLLVFAAHLPLSLFALLTFRRSFWAKWDDRGRLLLQFLHCWTWPNLLFWSLVPNHNIRYALPLSPGLMGLGVMGLLGLFRANPDREGGGKASTPSLTVGVRLLAGFLCCWLILKVAFVEFVIPARTAKHNPEPIAAELRALVPEGQPLYLLRLKDEGVLFYFGRPALRLHHPSALPSGAFAVLIQQEWEDRSLFGHLELIHWMRDQQGDPLILVRAR
jgi:4-amino-4-deoxy-L-arabinose transferase-like glycosyltransferase